MTKTLIIGDIVITRKGYIGKVDSFFNILDSLKEDEVSVGFGGASHGKYKIKELIKVNTFLASAIKGIYRRTLKNPDREKWNIDQLNKEKGTIR